MLFSSPTFLFYFLPILLLIYSFSRSINSQNWLLLIGSLLFYAWGELRYIPLLFFSILITHFASTGIVRSDKYRKRYLIIGVTSQLLLLIFFKYYNFIQINLLQFGATLPVLNVSLPLGISFFTFQAIAQIIDIYREPDDPKYKSIGLRDTGLYIVFFPQLIAGPIVRFKDIISRLNSRTIQKSHRLIGTKLFITGLGFKVIVADKLAPIADYTFQLGSRLDWSEAWLGAIAYTLQLYFDFWGYSLMAIGLGLMFGFRLPHNFNDPYTSLSITDFWRRWHMSLSTWFRDYVYIPLGGNRVSKFRNLVNLMIVFVLTGFWHGAAWTFLLWGIWHGGFLIFEKYFRIRQHWAFMYVYTLMVVIFGWVLFKSENLTGAIDYWQSMFGFGGNGVFEAPLSIMFLNDTRIILVIACIIALTRRSFRKRVYRKMKINNMVSGLIYFALFFVCVLMVYSNTYSPFLYFRF